MAAKRKDRERWVNSLPSRFPLFTSTGMCKGLAFSPDGRRLAAVGYEGTMTLLDAAAGKRVLQLRSLGKSRPGDVASNGRVAFSPDVSMLVCTNWDGSISVWDGRPSEQ